MKVWWVPKFGGAVVYSPTEHAQRVQKFLYWAEPNVLIAGDEESHKELHRKARNQGTSLRETDEFAPQQPPDGCGNAMAGIVLGWKSEGFGIETHEHFRPVILKALGLEDL